MINGFPDISYADADGVSIAYSVSGEGPDLLRVPGFLNGVLAGTVDPVVRVHYEHLATFTRLIVVDRRGLGMSDPLTAGGAPRLEQQVADLLAVLDAAESEKASLYASGDGTPVALLFAAMHPARVRGLIVNSGYARLVRADDYPYGPDAWHFNLPVLSAHERWGDRTNPWGLEFVAPSRVADPGFRQVLARVQQVSASRAAAAAAMSNTEHDVRDVLPLVQAPTLVLCGADCPPDQALGRSRFLVDHLPNARLSTYPGADTYLGAQAPEVGAQIEEFITGVRPPPVSTRVLATVLFTDIVGSTNMLTTLGDHRWAELLDRHDQLIHEALQRFRGRAVKSTGDGVLATFEGPGWAIECAEAITEAVKPLGIEVRAGLHVGECEVRGDDLGGIALHVASRIADLAGPSEVLVSRTVVDLVAGSTFRFEDRDAHQLRGVPGSWPLFAATTDDRPQPT